MNQYQEFRDRQQKEFNQFPMYFAFGQKQFDEMLQKMDAKPEDLYGTGYGGYYLKTDSQKLKDLTDKFYNELLEKLKDPAFAFDAFRYELANHEYCITGDLKDTMDAIGLTAEEINQDPILLEALRAALKSYKEGIDEYEKI